MSLVINSNTLATVTRNYLDTNQENLQTSLARLASGVGMRVIGSCLNEKKPKTTAARNTISTATGRSVVKLGLWCGDSIPGRMARNYVPLLVEAGALVLAVVSAGCSASGSGSPSSRTREFSFSPDCPAMTTFSPGSNPSLGSMLTLSVLSGRTRRRFTRFTPLVPVCSL